MMLRVEVNILPMDERPIIVFLPIKEPFFFAFYQADIFHNEIDNLVDIIQLRLNQILWDVIGYWAIINN